MANEQPELIHKDPGILGGTPVFVGTRVPVDTLVEWMVYGESLEDFLDNFPSVSREQAVTVLKRMAAALPEDESAA